MSTTSILRSRALTPLLLRAHSTVARRTLTTSIRLREPTTLSADHLQPGTEKPSEATSLRTKNGASLEAPHFKGIWNTIFLEPIGLPNVTLTCRIDTTPTTPHPTVPTHIHTHTHGDGLDPSRPLHVLFHPVYTAEENKSVQVRSIPYIHSPS